MNPVPCWNLVEDRTTFACKYRDLQRFVQYTEPYSAEPISEGYRLTSLPQL